jgi:hypothetical protein
MEQNDTHQNDISLMAFDTMMASRIAKINIGFVQVAHSKNSLLIRVPISLLSMDGRKEKKWVKVTTLGIKTSRKMTFCSTTLSIMNDRWHSLYSCKNDEILDS